MDFLHVLIHLIFTTPLEKASTITFISQRRNWHADTLSDLPQSYSKAWWS